MTTPSVRELQPDVVTDCGRQIPETFKSQRRSHRSVRSTDLVPQTMPIVHEAYLADHVEPGVLADHGRQVPETVTSQWRSNIFVRITDSVTQTVSIVHKARLADQPINLLHDDPLAVLSMLAGDKEVEKFDTGASHCMTGDPTRHCGTRPTRPVRIVGFKSPGSVPIHIGMNHDGVEEYYVSDIPENITLLFANAYCQEGCDVLFTDSGIVLRMSSSELYDMKAILRSYPVQRKLRVRNRTYKVDSASASDSALTVEMAHVAYTLEEALQGTASRFFNTRVNVSYQEERILTLPTTGLTFRDWKTHLKHESLHGIPRDLSKRRMDTFEYRYGRTFEYRYGRTPDVMSLGNPRSVRDATGLRDDPPVLSHCGERIEIDVMFLDYNIRESDGHNQKLPSHGGVIVVAVCVDCHSSFVSGQLLKRISHLEDFVGYFLVHYQNANHPVEGVAADAGIITNPEFQVTDTEKERLFLRWHVRKVERWLHHNHARITGCVEIEIQLVKQIVRLSMTLILRNPNFTIFGFTVLEV